MSEEKVPTLDDIKHALLKIADSYNDKALYATKLAHKLNEVRFDVVLEFLNDINALLGTEITFDKKWLAIFRDTVLR